METQPRNRNRLNLQMVKPGVASQREDGCKEISFIFPRTARGKVGLGADSTALASCDVLVLNGTPGGKLATQTNVGLEFWTFSLSLEDLFPSLCCWEILPLPKVRESLGRWKYFPATSPPAVECHMLLAEGSPHFDLSHRSQLLGMVAELLDEQFKRAKHLPEGLSRAENHTIAVFERLSLAQLLELPIEDLATKFGCSRRHLNRTFNQQFDMSVTAVRLELRLLKAAALLRNPEAKLRHCKRRSGRPCVWSSLGLILWISSQSLLAQDALQNLIALDTGRELRQKQVASENYTWKSGDFRLLATPSLGIGWNDNINASSSGAESSFILQPKVQFDMTYPITDVNLLTLNLGLGYDEYFGHPKNSGWRINTGSGVAFDIFVKDFVINLHDRVSYSQDTSQNPEVANAPNFGNFENTIGLATTWLLKNASFTLGYDHQNTVSPEAAYDYQNNGAEILLARATFIVDPKVQTGLEGTVALTDYTQPVLNDNTAYSLGPFVSWQPGTALQLTARGGYTYYQFDQTSTTIKSADISTYYLDLTVTHAATEVISYGFSAGRNVELGYQSDATELWYVRPNVTWHIFQHISLLTGFTYEHGIQGAGDASGGLNEIYDWLGFNVGLNWPVMKRLTVGLNYRLTLRSSDLPDNGYSQNVIGLLFTYTPK